MLVELDFYKTQNKTIKTNNKKNEDGTHMGAFLLSEKKIKPLVELVAPRGFKLYV